MDSNATGPMNWEVENLVQQDISLKSMLLFSYSKQVLLIIILATLQNELE